MRYSDYKCDGCGRVFQNDDDIVVCPECATPQHRECYKEKGGCVNAHLHAEGFQWQGEKQLSEKPVQPIEEKKETAPDLICPNCQHPNPHGSTSCQRCGMKFTIFGINLAEKAQELDSEDDMDPTLVNPDAEPKMTPPSYPPPFTVGSGERKDEKPSLPHNREEQMENFLSSTIENASGFSSEQGSEQLFKGPYPDDMTIDGIPANTMGAFIARESHKYIDKFIRLASGKKLSFNWAAFFLSPYWFFYRKQFKPGIIFMTLQLCLGVLMTPSANSFLEFYDYLAGLDTAALTEAAALEITAQMNELFLPMAIFMGAELIIKLVAGFIANPLYKSYTVRQIKAIEALPDRRQKLSFILKYGGVSPLMPLAAYFAEQMLSMIASYFF